jgi:Na+/H+-dicarboxylate symporter
MNKPRKTDAPTKKRRLGLAEKVLIGLVMGVAVGVFFGERVGFLEIGGQAFIMLLQMTAIPYILVSLITALGRLSLGDAKMLGVKAGTILLGLWGVGLVIVLVSPLAFPDWASASFFSTSQIEEAEPVDFLQLYIPANPFFSLANTVVPAIVVFSVLVGLALTGVDNKEVLLKPLSAFGDTLMGVAGMIGKLAPYGIFALVASAAGTIDVGDLNRLQVYVVVYMAMALILSFWILPGLVAAFTPLRHVDVVRTFRGPLLVAFATANLLIILPILASDCRKLLETGAPRGRGTAAEEAEAESSVDVLIPAAYPFPTLGLVLSLIFVLFAGWYIGSPVSIAQYPAIATAGLASLFGSTPIAIPFLLDLLQLPQDLFQVFLTVDVIGSRFGTLLAAMHIITIALIGPFALQGALRVRTLPLLRTAGMSVALVAAALIGIRVSVPSTPIAMRPLAATDATRQGFHKADAGRRIVAGSSTLFAVNQFGYSDRQAATRSCR